MTGELYIGYTYFGRPVNYTITVIKTPRPGYNTGGLGFGDAPTIVTGPTNYGSIVPEEPGQFYRIHLNRGELVFLTGQATGHASWSPEFTINLFDQGQVFEKTLIGVVAGGTVEFPANPPTYTNSGDDADYYLQVNTRFHPTHDFQFAVQRLINGPSTVWWFQGENPQGYDTALTLDLSRVL